MATLLSGVVSVLAPAADAVVGGTVVDGAGGASGAFGLAAQETLDPGAPDPLVEEVVFRGVDALDEDAVRAAVRIRPTRCRTILLQPFCWLSEGGFFQQRERLDREELRRDELRIRVFYWLRGFRDAEVSSVVAPRNGDVAVRFEVREGPPTRTRSVEVAQEDTAVLSPGEIADAGLPVEGEPLNMVRLRTAVDTLRAILWDRGFANAVVEDSVTVDETGSGDGALADVRLRIRPGRPVTVERVLVQGNEEISDRTVRRAAGLREGTRFRRGELEDAQRRLYRTRLFRQSAVTTLEDDPALARVFQAPTEEGPGAPTEPDGPPRPLDDTVGPGGDTLRTLGDTLRTVVVAVREAPFDEVGLGVGFTTVEFAQAEARYARHNFLGGGRRIELQGALGNLLAPALHDEPLFRDALPVGVGRAVAEIYLEPTWTLSAGFTQPWLGSTANALDVRLFARRRTVPGVVVDRSFGGEVTFTRSFGPGASASATYRLEETRVDADGVYFCVNFGVCDGRTIGALGRFLRLSPLRLDVRAERLDDPMSPTRGFSVNLEAEYASRFTASDYRYRSLSVEGTYYRPLGPGVVAARVRAAGVRSLPSEAVAPGIDDAGASLLHPRKRLYAGGARSVRGYGENQLGPRILTVPASALTGADGGTDGEGDTDGGGAADGEGSGPCTVASIEARTCDPNELPSEEFQPRPLGGDEVIEASLEYRFPLVWELGGAVFVDAGYVADLNLAFPTAGRAAVTPGFGVRYRSPVGMIRVDLGVRPTLVERLPVVTAVGEGRERRLVTLETSKQYDPVGASQGFLEGVYRRLVLHLSIGEAF